MVKEEILQIVFKSCLHLTVCRVQKKSAADDFENIFVTISLFSDLSLQAAQKVKDADPNDALKVLGHVSQNFPTVARYGLFY